MLTDTQVRDTTGTVYDLDELVDKMCTIITDQGMMYMATRNDYYRRVQKYWTASNGNMYSSKGVAYLIRRDNCNITVHQF